MALRERRSYCVFGCEDLGAYMHGFPHPKRRPDMFKKWMSVVGKRVKETDPIRIYKNKKVCSRHFKLDQKVACHRLMWSAVPSLELGGVSSTPGVLVGLEHNYCFPGIQILEPALPTIDTGSIIPAQQSFNDNLSPPSETQYVVRDYKYTECLIKMNNSDQNEIRLFKTELGKTKKIKLKSKSHVAVMNNTLSCNSAIKIVTTYITLLTHIFTRIQFYNTLKNFKGRKYDIDKKLLALYIYILYKGYLYFKYLNCYVHNAEISGYMRQLAPGINETVFKNGNDIGGLMKDCLLSFLTRCL